MKKFDTPVLVEVTDLAEGIYASSGAVTVNPNPTPNPTPAPDQPKWIPYWDHHNGGQKSYIRLKGCQHGKAGNKVTITLQLTSGAGIKDKIHDGDGRITFFNDNTIVIEREGLFNAGDSIDFNVGAFSFKNSPDNKDATGAYYSSDIAGVHQQEEMTYGPFQITSINYSYY